jgi:hypothetical protein
VTKLVIFDRKFLLKIGIIAGIFANFMGYMFYEITGEGYPLFRFMTSKVGRFDDFYNNLFMPGEYFQTKANFTMYPGSIFIYKIFSITNVNLAAIIFLTLTSFILFWNLGKLSSSLLFVIFVFVSYPYHFTIARGNNEIILVSLGALIYLSLKEKKFGKSTFLTSILMIIEPYPYYVFSLVGAKKKTFVQVLKFSIPLLFITLWLLTKLNIRSYFATLITEGSSYVTGAGPGSTLHSSGLTGLIQFIYLQSDGEFPYKKADFMLLSRVIPYACTILLLIFFIYYHKKIDLITSSLLIVSGWTLLSGSSFDYRLLHFFIPLAIIVSNQITKYELSIFIAVLALMIPKPYLWFTAPNNSIGETLGSVVNPLLLMLIIVLTFYRFFSVTLKIKNKNKNV